MLGRERPPLYAPCLDRSERSSPLLHPPSKQDLPASVPALVGADQHHLSGLGLPTTLPEGSDFVVVMSGGGVDWLGLLGLAIIIGVAWVIASRKR